MSVVINECIIYIHYTYKLRGRSPLKIPHKIKGEEPLKTPSSKLREKSPLRPPLQN